MSSVTESKTREFEHEVLPHLSAAYRLALWLTRNPTAAQDVVQDSYLRAFRAWNSFETGNVRGWLLTIVRRQSYSFLRRGRKQVHLDINDETAMSPDDVRHLSHESTPEKVLIQGQSVEALRAALLALPTVFREVIILKDIEDMPYKAIAAILEVPIGTVMSRLARGRDLLRQGLKEVRS